MPKGPVIQDMSIIGKGGNSNMEDFFSMPQILSFKPQKGCPLKEDKHRGGHPFHPSTYVGNGYKVKGVS